MIRFRTLMFLLSMTVLTALASYSFFEPFTQGKIPQAVLDVSSDTNPYDDDFFTPDNSGLRSSRQKEMGSELPSFQETPQAELCIMVFPSERERIPASFSASKCEMLKLLLSAAGRCAPVPPSPVPISFLPIYYNRQPDRKG